METSPIKTDFPITIGGNEYSLTFPLQALWDLQDEAAQIGIDPGSGMSEEQMEALPARKQMEWAIAMLRVGLSTHHPQFKTSRDVARIVFFRDLERVTPIVVQAFNASMPDKATTEPGIAPLATTSQVN